MYRWAISLFILVTFILVCATSGATAQEKVELEGVEKTFKQFALAVKDDKYEEVVKCIAPPGDKVWIGLAEVHRAAAKYEAALNQKFGKSDERSWLEKFAKDNLAERYYEARGTIRDVKAINKDRALVTVWTNGPRFGTDLKAIYERKFIAVKVADEWKFQLRPSLGGSPVVKKVKRTTPDGKTIEVLAEHNPKGSGDQKNWEELKPNSYEGAEEELKLEAVLFRKFAAALLAQTEQVQKGSYKTRKEALVTLEKSLEELIESARKELKK